MWSLSASPDDPPDRRVALWLRALELLLTAVLLAVTLWKVLSGA